LPSSSDYGCGDLPFLRAKDVGRYVLECDQPVVVPRRYWNKKAVTKANDVLLEVKGEIRGGAVCPDKAAGCLVNGSIFRMALRDDVSPHYVTAVLLSELGLLQKRRAAANSVISYLSSDFLRALRIPRLPAVIEDRIGTGIADYMTSTEASEQEISRAKRDVEALIDGTLNEAELLKDSDVIERWLAAHPSPFAGEENT
jgi:hypothetical protein